MPANSSASYDVVLELEVASGQDDAAAAWAGPGYVAQSSSGGRPSAYAFAGNKHVQRVPRSGLQQTTTDMVGVSHYVYSGTELSVPEVFWAIGATRPWNATLHATPGDMHIDNGSARTDLPPSNATGLPDQVLVAGGMTFANVTWTSGDPVSAGDKRDVHIEAVASGWSHVEMASDRRIQSGDETVGNDACQVHHADGTQSDFGVTVAGTGLLGIPSLTNDRLADGRGTLSLACSFAGLTHDRHVLLTHIPVAAGAFEAGVNFDYA